MNKQLEAKYQLPILGLIFTKVCDMIYLQGAFCIILDFVCVCLFFIMKVMTDKHEMAKN